MEPQHVTSAAQALTELQQNLGMDEPTADENPHEEEEEEQQGVPALVTMHLQVPVHDLVSAMQPMAQGIQADIVALQNSIQLTTQTATAEKQAVDEELHRMQQLVRQFQEHMAQILQVSLGL